MFNNSALRLWSLGVAASNRTGNSNQLSVTPYEVTPLLDGELDDTIAEMIESGKDAFGVEYSVKVKTSAAIVCDWLPFSALPITAPYIRRGERVAIYRFGDSDKYYWVDKGLDRHLRRLETIIWRVSATGSEAKGVTLDETNCYYFTVSSHSKLISFTTSKANGEPFGYVFQFDLSKGIWTVTDDAGTFVQINSAEKLIHLQNAAGAWLKLADKDILAYSPNDINIEAVNLITLICKDLVMRASKTMLFDAKESITSVTPDFKVDAAESTFTGNVKVDKNLTVDGTLNASKGTIGGVSFENGAMNCKTLTAELPISAPNV